MSLKQKELSGQIGCSVSTIYLNLKELIEAGLLKVFDDENNRREKLYGMVLQQHHPHTPTQCSTETASVPLPKEAVKTLWERFPFLDGEFCRPSIQQVIIEGLQARKPDDGLTEDEYLEAYCWRENVRFQNLFGTTPRLKIYRAKQREKALAEFAERSGL